MALHNCHSHKHTIYKARPKGGAQWEALRRYADSVEPRFRRAFLSAINNVKDRATVERLARVLAEGRVPEVLAELRVTERDFAELLTTAEQTFQRSAQVMEAQIVASNVRFEGHFDITNPEAINHLRNYRMNLIREVSDETRDAIRDVVHRAFERGGHPYEQAREIRELVGLTRRQARAVDNYRGALQEEGRSAEQVQRMTERYAQRVLNRRAENIARTETIRASSEGQEALFRQAQANGWIDRENTRRIWVITPDDRLCPVCEAIPDMNPEGVRVGEPFQTPNGPVMAPPAHPQCRCAISLDFEE
jgi:hypothetical protein